MLGGTGVVAAEDAGRTSDIAGKLGVEPGMVVQELGWDSDVDEAVRDAVEERAGDELLDEDADEVVDLVIMWWREGDGDLVDALIDAIGPLADNGVIWVLTPKTGRRRARRAQRDRRGGSDRRAVADVQRHHQRRLGRLPAGRAQGGPVAALTSANATGPADT